LGAPRRWVFGSPPGPLSSLAFVPPDFLNSREDAILVWAVLILGYVTYKGPSIWLSFFGLARMVFASKLTLLFGSAAVYSAAIVLLAKKLGLWHTTALKETIYWFVGTGVVLAGNATHATPSPDFLKQIIGRLLRITLVIEFVVNLYVFPLAVELVLVFLVLAFAGMQAAAPYTSGIDQATRKVIDGVLVGIGVFLIASFGVTALSDLDGFLSRETAERFLVVPALTLAFIPFLYLVEWYSQRRTKEHPAPLATSRGSTRAT
jgi:hypothetical protein